MRTRILIIALCLLTVGRAWVQWTVIDPSNIAQSIVNTSKNVVHTSTTAENMVKNFKETVKIYEQSKKYYDALKSVNFKQKTRVGRNSLHAYSVGLLFPHLSSKVFSGPAY